MVTRGVAGAAAIDGADGANGALPRAQRIRIRPGYIVASSAIATATLRTAGRFRIQANRGFGIMNQFLRRGWQYVWIFGNQSNRFHRFLNIKEMS